MRHVIRPIIFFLVLLSLFLYAYGENGYNCFSIIVGKDASANGSVMIAHNEDDTGINFVNVHRIPATYRNPKEKTIKLKNGALIPAANHTHACLWLQLPGQEFADSYFNEKGVVIASNQCRSREDNGALTEGGIGFMLRRLVALQANSARDAVRLAGKLIERYGYYSTGRTYCIADSKEGWIFHAIKGKRWLAQRVPDDQVVVIANYYIVEGINLDDKENFLGSPDIINYAIKRGWYQPAKEKEFDFAKVYSNQKNLVSMVNVLRQWRATNRLSDKQYDIHDRFPFSFKPRRKVRLIDLFRVLRDHYEDTEYDLTKGYKDGSPNSTKNRAICDESTQYSFVAQLRSDLPPELANVAWISFRRPDSNAYAPWYLSILAPPEGYTVGDTRTALKDHFTKSASYLNRNTDYAFWAYARLSERVDLDYRQRIRFTQKEWKNFENFLLKSREKKEKEFLYLLEKDKNIALKIITNYVHQIEYRKWFITSELLERIKKEELEKKEENK